MSRAKEIVDHLLDGAPLPYRGADNPGNPHGPKILAGSKRRGAGVAGGLKGRGVDCQLVERKTPFLPGKKSRRPRRHRWVPR